MQLEGHSGNLILMNARLPFNDVEKSSQLWTIHCNNGRITSISPEEAPSCAISNLMSILDANGSLVIPSLCHSHIHLDKCFILDRCGNLVKGDFQEAMQVTNKAKVDFARDINDLYKRGELVIRGSVECGVTAMRAHVEVDTLVQFSCIDIALKLQDAYKSVCDVQIAAFAQEPLFSRPGEMTPGPNFLLLKEAIQREGVTVVGSAPYVEPTIEQAKLNIALIFEIATTGSVDHIDFHLDYNLDPDSEPLIFEVFSQARKFYSISSVFRHRVHITIGHATRLQLFPPSQWRQLIDAMDELPITLVSLPQSDIYMQGRDMAHMPLGPPRGTLRVPYLVKEYGLQVAMSVNNVENAFTPQGILDPLSLCTFGVAVFQSATAEDIRTLVRSVTLTSKRAIGEQEVPVDLVPSAGDYADFVVLQNRHSLQAAVLSPCFDRITIRRGRVVAKRYAESTIAL
ncbi:hypothetical protein BDQ17DRAFT_1297204 [Cyathus striatus]|nr:hypothetical protein BDQ17DRAFT_1297204 [Cyathus striatus]